MVFVLIPTAWLAVVFFALKMCHLAARSDHSYEVAVAEGIARDRRDAHRVLFAIRAGSPPPARRRRIHRTAG